VIIEAHCGKGLFIGDDEEVFSLLPIFSKVNLTYLRTSEKVVVFLDPSEYKVLAQ